jgi:hypothetical protein
MVKKTLRGARATTFKHYADNDSFIDEVIDGFTNPHPNACKNAKSSKYVLQTAATAQPVQDSNIFNVEKIIDKKR